MTSLFMTATGTDVGKTHISAAYLAHLRGQGLSPLPVKPLMSGVAESDLEGSDAGRLLKACGLVADLEGINAVCMRRFEAALSPNMAAREMGQALDYDDILAFVNARVLMTEDSILVEGAGGVMSPVTDDKLHVDLINDLAMPCFMVTANYLGAISHTLTALETLKARATCVLGVIVSQPGPDATPPDSLIDELARWTDIPLLAAPYAEAPEDLSALAARMQELAG